MSDTERGSAAADEPPNGSARAGRDRHAASEAGMPRWVKLSAVIVAVGVVLLVVMLALGHGPGRHGHAGAASVTALPVGIVGARVAGGVGGGA